MQSNSHTLGPGSGIELTVYKLGSTKHLADSRSMHVNACWPEWQLQQLSSRCSLGRLSGRKHQGWYQMTNQNICLCNVGSWQGSYKAPLGRVRPCSRLSVPRLRHLQRKLLGEVHHSVYNLAVNSDLKKQMSFYPERWGIQELQPQSGCVTCQGWTSCAWASCASTKLGWPMLDRNLFHVLPFGSTCSSHDQ